MGGGGGPPSGNRSGGQMSAEDARQFAREMQQRLGEAEALRNDLSKQGVDVSALNKAIESMRSAATQADDSKSASDLRAQVVDGLKAFEFALRKALGAEESGRVMTGRTGDVPPAFRSYVEEYYRAISKPPVPPKP